MESITASTSATTTAGDTVFSITAEAAEVSTTKFELNILHYFFSPISPFFRRKTKLQHSPVAAAAFIGGEKRWRQKKRKKNIIAFFLFFSF